MRRFLSTSLIALALSMSALSVAPVAHAQTSYDAFGNAYSTAAEASAADTKASSAAAAASSKQSAGGGMPTDGSKASSDDGFNIVMQKIMELFAWLVGVAALTLDTAVFYTVVRMGEYVNNLSAIGVAWRILRDVGNIMLIFGFLAIGITTIIDKGDWYGGGKKMLPMLFIGAIFLNFSLFFTEAVIDTGNLFATQFYKQINGGNLPTAAMTQSATVQDEGISNKLMAQLGLQTLYNVNSGKVNKEVFKGTNPWLIGFMGILLFIVTAFVLFSLAFILIARFVILIFLIILAPVGFAGLAVPQLKGRAKQWWDTLFEQTLTAPVLLLMLYVALAVITDARFLVGFNPTGGEWLDFVNNNNLAGFGGVLLSFLVAMGLLLFVVVAAKKLSAFGAGWATKTAGGLTGALSFGAISLAGRGTFGTAGYLLNNKRMQARAAGGGLGGFAAKAASFTGRNLEKRTFDFRNVPGVRTAGSIAGGALASSGIEGAFAGGSAGSAKSAIEKTRETVKTYKPFSGDWWRDQQKEYEAAKSEIDRNAALVAAAVPTMPPNPASLAAQKELKRMSADELASLKDIRGGIDTLVHNLSPEKFNELMKSDKLLAGEKAKLQATWSTQFNAANAATTISRLSTEEVAALGGGTILSTDPGIPGSRPVIDALGTTELDAIRRKGNLTRDQRHDIFDHMTSPAASPALAAVVADYFLPANDPGGARDKYWNV